MKTLHDMLTGCLLTVLNTLNRLGRRIAPRLREERGDVRHLMCNSRVS